MNVYLRTYAHAVCIYSKYIFTYHTMYVQYVGDCVLTYIRTYICAYSLYLLYVRTYIALLCKAKPTNVRT